MESLVTNLTTSSTTQFNDVYKGKKVLVTGHTGFKGSWLSLWLYCLGAEVVGYALDPPTNPSLFEELALAGMIIHVVGDVKDACHLQQVFYEHEPNFVFHLAAQPLVRYSYLEPKLTYETNVLGTVNVLEAVRHCPSVQVVLNITSDKCYENKEWVYAYRENDPLGGLDPYSSSKGCAELITSAYRSSFFKDSSVRLASVRAGNVIGGGDWAVDRVIPDCVRALEQAEPINIRNPKAVRPWQHVLEPLSGYLWLSSLMWTGGHEFDGPWNFGPHAQSNITVANVVEKFIGGWGSGSWRKPSNSDVLQEAQFLKLDCTRAANLLGWDPIYSIDRTIEATAAWYRAFHLKSESALDITLADIQDYVSEAKTRGLAWAGGDDHSIEQQVRRSFAQARNPG